jgi:hypothetical protein
LKLKNVQSLLESHAVPLEPNSLDPDPDDPGEPDDLHDPDDPECVGGNENIKKVHEK